MDDELNGILVIDKPENMTSAKLVARVKNILKIKKVGHTGTLDPMATGVMICCLNKATRLARFLLQGQKTYEAVLCLGIETDTQDSTGTIVSEGDCRNVSQDQVLSVISRFSGEIWQTPPVYSALKHNGTPLYKLARDGKKITKPARKMFISNITVDEIKLPLVRFRVTCSAGTYVRTICHDIGKALGCGGHLTSLRRTEACGFSIQSALTLENLQQISEDKRISDYVIEMTEALKQMPEYMADRPLQDKIGYGMGITSNDLNRFEAGQPLDDLLHGAAYLKIIDHQRKLLAIVEYSSLKQQFNYCCVFTGH